MFWPLLFLCRPFCIFERCLDSNPESCHSKQARFPTFSYTALFKLFYYIQAVLNTGLSVQLLPSGSLLAQASFCDFCVLSV